MGGAPKGLLPVDEGGEPIVVRLARLAAELGMEPVLVGRADAYRAALPGLRCLADAPEGIGPLGGLGGLLEAAAGDCVLAVACDMPRVSRALLTRLSAPCAADVLAPQSDGKWEPLCAAYDAAAVLPALRVAISGGVRSFQALFATLNVAELVLDAHERRELVDWDRPEDMVR
jgi:molybdenum cofactor guanylyltransferase